MSEPQIQQTIRKKLFIGLLGVLFFHSIARMSLAHKDSKLLSFFAVYITLVTVFYFILLFYAKKLKSTIFPKSVRPFVIILYFNVVLGFLSFIVLGTYSTVIATKDLFKWLQSLSFSRREITIITSVMTLCIGIFLFLFRLYLRSLYGLSEVVVGVIVAANRASAENAFNITNSSFLLALLTAGIYLVVRGLDNLHQGISKAPFDPIALRIIVWSKKLSKKNKEIE